MTLPVKIAHIATVDMSLRYLLLNQLRSLKQCGYEVVGISTSGPDVPVIEAAGIRHIPVHMTRRAFTPLADLRSFWDLYRVLKRERFALIHTHTPKAGLLGRWVARLVGVPVIVHTHHGFIFHDGSTWLWRRFFTAMEKFTANFEDLCFSVNAEDIPMAIREGITRADKICALGAEGIDVSRFDRSRFTSAELVLLRHEIGIPEGARVVGFVGRLVREKGLLDLLSAARTIRERVPNVHFLIIGPVDHAKPDVLKPDVAERYQVGDICHFTGIREDIPALDALMDVFCLPSYREGLPVSAQEASAMGVPCVVTDVRGCRETVIDGRNGLVVPVGNPPALADAIVRLLQDRTLAEKMGQEGRRMAVETFDEQLVFDIIKAEYARLLRAKGLNVPNAAVQAETMAPLLGPVR